MSDDRLGDMMRASLAGDGDAYRALLIELGSMLRNRIRAIMGRSGSGHADVEDIVQETLLAIHLKRDNWDPTLLFMPWVSGIVRYKVIDALRRRGNRTTVPIEDWQHVLASPPEANTDIGDVESLVKRLSARKQAIVRALSIEGRSVEQVALELGMTEGALRVALHRALKELAALYRGDSQ
jgi:RNA polymerase sigma-70 factor (ECF subfamily)